jgi:hypothetical protein
MSDWFCVLLDVTHILSDHDAKRGVKTVANLNVTKAMTMVDASSANIFHGKTVSFVNIFHKIGL